MTPEVMDKRYSSDELIEMEAQFGAHNYKPLPVVLSRGEGVFVWDVEGSRYFDFLAAYSSLNQGHCHPRLVKAMREQIGTLTLTSRAFYNDMLGRAEKFLAETFGYDKVLLMNSGAEAVETSIKLARRWAYDTKGIEENKAKIVVAENNFHGRTTGVISFSTDPSSKKHFGPFMPGFEVVRFNDTEVLERAFQDEAVCAFLVEPIQGEAGVQIPDPGYLKTIRELCDQYNVLLLADEIQTGLGRTGKMLACEHEDVRPDVILLGKALSGGMMPVSAVLCDDYIMMNIKPGEHGSTYGGNPLGARIVIEAVQIITETGLLEKVATMGEYFRMRIRDAGIPYLSDVRGKGLFSAIEIDNSKIEASAYDICKMLKENGLLAKQTHGNIIRFAPPLIITQPQLEACCEIIINTLRVAEEEDGLTSLP